MVRPSRRVFFLTLTTHRADVKTAALKFEEEFFGCPSIGYQKASSERKKARNKRGIQDQTEDVDQKGKAGNRVEKPRYCFRSAQSGQSSFRESCQQGYHYA
jgi:hypothetical protein